MKHIVIDARIRRSSTGRYIDRLIEHLQKIDQANRYSVLVQPDDPWRPVATNFSRVDCAYPQFSLNPLHQFGFANQLYKLKADLVHFPMNQQPILYLKTVVTSCMDLTMLRFTRAGRRSRLLHEIRMIAYRFLFWFSLKKSNAIITITKFVKSDVEQHYPFTKGRITVTYCASEPPLRIPSKKLRAYDLSKPFIMHVGSPFPHKNIDQLVSAFGILKEKYPNLKLVLAGKREYYFEQLEKSIANIPYRKDIIIPGFIEDAELKWLYQNAEAYVLPSLSEGFGLPGLEAMAHGCPVASSNATCLPEVYKDAALYFDPLSAEDMAEKIAQLLDDKKLAGNLVSNGNALVKTYSWQRMAEQTLTVFNKVLNQK